jgi:hypothetical protein
MLTSPTSSALRWFGCILAAVFGVLGTVIWWQVGLGPARVPWATGLVLTVFYYAVPPLRMPMYLTWMAAVRPIGRIVSLSILAVVYYGVITPISLSMRPFRRDRLGRRFDPDAPSHWIDCDPDAETPRYFRQS